MGYRRSVTHLWECDIKGPDCVGICERYFGKILEYEEIPRVDNPPDMWAKIVKKNPYGILYVCYNCLAGMRFNKEDTVELNLEHTVK